MLDERISRGSHVCSYLYSQGKNRWEEGRRVCLSTGAGAFWAWKEVFAPGVFLFLGFLLLRFSSWGNDLVPGLRCMLHVSLHSGNADHLSVAGAEGWG